MVLSSVEAIALTNNAITIHTQQDVGQEVGLAENVIREASRQKRFRILYNARIIGNPSGDPVDDDQLTAAQISFRDAFVTAGYAVTLDADSENWGISWEATGAEQLVNIYSIRTTLTPGAIQSQTIAAINSFFSGLSPVVKSRAVLVNPTSSGGDIDESDFGGTASVFYEYIGVVDQPNEDDHSVALVAALVASGLGYNNSVPDNIEVYKVA